MRTELCLELTLLLLASFLDIFDKFQFSSSLGVGPALVCRVMRREISIDFIAENILSIEDCGEN